MHAFAFVAAAAFGSIVTAQILPSGFVVETLAPGQTGPTSLDFLPDGRVLFAEQHTGAVKVLAVAAGNTVATLGAVPGLRISYSQGLLGVAVDPQWPARPFVYCYHTNLAAADLRITRFTITGDLTNAASTNLQLGQAYVVLAALPDATPLHEAGCLRFGPDGMLYCTVGDDDDACAAQDITQAKGKLLRLRVDTLSPTATGTAPRAMLVPPGNPFAGPGDLAPLVYAYGLRNPFRFHIDPANGAIFVADVGDAQRDEIDRFTAPGTNLGWPWFEGSLTHTTCTGAPPTNLVPIAEQPVPAAQFLALISVGVCRVPATAPWRFGASYDGDYFYTDHFTGRIWRLQDTGSGWAIAPPVPGQFSPALWGEGVYWIVDAKFGPDGALYFCERVAPAGGSVRRIRPTTATWSTFGSGCGGSFGTPVLAAAPGSLPSLGTTFQMRVNGLPQPPAGLTLGMLGTSKTSWNTLPLPFDLAVIGMPGCQALIAPLDSAVLAHTGTVATWPLVIPLAPNLIGVDFYAQALVLDAGWNPLGAVVTNGGEGVIR
jgi:glucose/arabinose dehydrogenase